MARTEQKEEVILWAHTTEELRLLRNANLHDRRLDILLRLSRGHSIATVVKQARCLHRTVVQTIQEYNKTKLREYTPMPQLTNRQGSYAYLYWTYTREPGYLVLWMHYLNLPAHYIAQELKISQQDASEVAWKYFRRLK